MNRPVIANTTSKIQVRRANDRFHSEHGWLNSWHTFSFGDHSDPAFAGFESLRVINDDTVAPNHGFGEHGHAAMEIISYVISGQLQHQDSMGNGRTIRAGEFQYMSAGTGVRHAERNPSATDPVHFLQIWITPREERTQPRYQELSVHNQKNGQKLTLIASPDGRDGSIEIHQDVDMRFGRLAKGESLIPKSSAAKHWVHLIAGEVHLLDEVLTVGDGAAVEGELGRMTAAQDSEFLIFSIF